MDIKINTATKENLPEILRLYSLKDFDDGKKLDIKKAEEIFDKMNKYPDYKLYIALYNNKVVGTFSLVILDNIAHLGKSSGLLEDIIVNENFRSKGIGKKMMEYAINLFRENNCYKMALSSNLKRNRAHSFYEKLGFEKHGYSYIINI